jgi:hypothetical protein
MLHGVSKRQRRCPAPTPSRLMRRGICFSRVLVTGTVDQALPASSLAALICSRAAQQKRAPNCAHSAARAALAGTSCLSAARFVTLTSAGSSRRAAILPCCLSPVARAWGLSEWERDRASTPAAERLVRNRQGSPAVPLPRTFRPRRRGRRDATSGEADALIAPTCSWACPHSAPWLLSGLLPPFCRCSTARRRCQNECVRAARPSRPRRILGRGSHHPLEFDKLPTGADLGLVEEGY